MHNLSVAASFACALFAIHLLLSRPLNRTPSVLLGTTFLVFALQSFLLSLVLSSDTPHWARIVRPTAAMTIGPLVSFYFASAAEPGFRVRPRHAVHLLPALLVAFELLAGVYPIDIDLAIIASFAIYSIVAIRRAARGPSQFSHLGDAGRSAYRWLLASATLLVLSCVVELSITADLSRGRALADSIPLVVTLVLNLVVVAVAILAALMRPSPLEWMYSFGAQARAPALNETERVGIIDRFERLVTRSRIFTEEGVSLRGVAGQLDIAPRQLSEAINRTYGESFSRRMNRYRVEEAKRLITTHPKKPLTDVMFEAGFRTKSSFNKEFRALAGASPSDYRARRINER